MKLLHQCGHCTIWNIQSFRDEKKGDGLIFSPVHENRTRIEAVSNQIRRSSLFDPQFFLPNSQKKKLHSYNFFPEVVTNGFSTLDFGLVAIESAKECIAFQLAQNFDKIVIPARFFRQMVSDFASKQEAYTVLPFLKELSRQKIKKKIVLTLSLTSHMVEDVAYRTNILNWVTGFPEISGIYLIVDHERPSKQVESKQFLFEMLVMVRELKNAGLEVTVGYANVESLIYLLAGDIDITMGAYENTRMFSIDKFLETDEERRGPKARIYLPALLNWIQFSQAKDIRDADDGLWRRIYQATPHSEAALRQTKEPSFNQPELYKHYFSVFTDQVEQLRPLSGLERYKVLHSAIKKAISYNSEISGIPIDLERHGAGNHLQTWLDVVNNYYRVYLKQGGSS